MFPDSFPFYKLERDLQAYINPLVFYILVMGTNCFQCAIATRFMNVKTLNIGFFLLKICNSLNAD